MNEDVRNAGGQEEPIDGEEIIDLTEVADEESAHAEELSLFDEDDGAISLDTAALEEEDEIVELVDVAEGESEDSEAEEPLDLSGLMDEQFEEESGGDEAEPVFSEEDAGHEASVADVGLEIEDTSIDIGDLSDTENELSESLELEEDAVTVPLEGPDTGSEQAGVAGGDRPEETGIPDRQEASLQGEDSDASEAVRSAVIDRLSDEKLEAIVTQVVQEAIEEKADRILLEVAETAIRKEIEKIKNAL
jgi:hypothetical protein